MTKEEVSLELARYLVAHWETVIAGITSFLGALIVVTWMAAKYWYEREIKHVRVEKEAHEHIHDKEIRHLTRQLSDKDAYAKGVIEVMSQRILSAQEDPQRLLRVINQHEHQLARLKEENANLLQITKEKSLDGAKGSPWKESIISNIRTELDFIIELNFDIDPDDRNVVFINKEYKDIKRASRNEQLDLKAVAPIMLFLLKAQSQKMAELDIGLAKCHRELNNSNTTFYESIIKIMTPLITEQNKRKEFEDTLFKIRDRKKMWYLDWMRQPKEAKELDENKNSDT